MVETATRTSCTQHPDRDWPREGEVPAPAHPMPIRVLLATDGSKEADAAQELLLHFAFPAGSAVEVMTVLDALPWQVPASLRGAEKEWAQRTVKAAGESFREKGVALSERIVRGEPAHEILQQAAASPVDLVVVGATGRTGLAGVVLGSVARNVAQHAVCSVLVGRRPLHQQRKVVLALDESENAQEALAFAAILPLPRDTEIVLCYVARPYQYAAMNEYIPSMLELLQDTWQEQHENGQKLLVKARAFLEEQGKRVTTIIRDGDPARELTRLAEQIDADLIIAGARGVSRIEGLLLGSVADRLLKQATSSVLIVR